MTYTKSFPIHFDPIANPEAVVTGPNVRFTVLTPRLLRLEYSPTAVFEDRPSQAFWYRNLPVPEFEHTTKDNRLTITTSHLQLSYKASDAGFTAETLAITLKASGQTWHFGDEDPLNLRGTARTLDDVDGALTLEEGLLSRSGYALCDDTPRLVFNDDGWPEPRRAPEGCLDLYFFGCGRDAAACLQDFARTAGPAPLIPRWALGNWWSRYWPYSAAELLGLMDEFRAHAVPLSVCIVDMDWHITDTGNAAGGWTGYTWNRDLFPDPAAFLAALHERGLKTALNLHPADGVYPHEEKYAEMAAALGVDPSGREPIPFDIADPDFARAYFEVLHHPLEAEGVDFWWIDWQQGGSSGLPGLDPLWWLNHLHFYDLGRGRKRPFIFSRWGGLGNHRYPIGFSGDTHVTWESLAFQPYFTATAANVNYGWWSHDVGGHMGGVEEAELFARWVQFGVFSPIFRLHSTNNPFHERRPWGWDAETARVTADAMRLRHRLIPYLYTMAWRNHRRHLPLARPMYHLFPAQEPAYHCPDQYLFGSELLAAPFTAPMAADVGLSRQVVWLPAGEWFDFFGGGRFAGDGWYAVYGGLDEIPVFAKAGGIVPLAVGDGLVNPEALALHLFPGADNAFDLYEDDGAAAHSLTPIRQSWGDGAWSVTIGPAEGETGHLPEARTWEVCFRGAADTAVSANTDFAAEYDSETRALRVTAVLPPTAALTITLSDGNGALLAADDRILPACQKLVAAFRMESWAKQRLFKRLPDITANPAGLAQFALDLTPGQLRALLEVITGAGFRRSGSRRSPEEQIVLWNNGGGEAVTYQLAAREVNGRIIRAVNKREPLPKFGLFTIGAEALRYHEGSRPAAGRMSVAAWFESLAAQVGGSALPDGAAVQFDLSGENGRVAYLVGEDGRVSLVDGVHPDPAVTLAAAAADWLRLLNGELTPEGMFLEGKLRMTGDLELALQLAGSISLSPPGVYRPDEWRLYVDYLDVVRLVGSGE